MIIGITVDVVHVEGDLGAPPFGKATHLALVPTLTDKLIVMHDILPVVCRVDSLEPLKPLRLVFARPLAELLTTSRVP